jgi:cellulose synthase/poly-beta-1,6-N-acetylglucosamine synthase-like glycosyltransferase
MTENILLLIFIILFVHYCLFLKKIFFGLNKLVQKGDQEIPEEIISVIVPFRNEEENIASVYSSLVNQNYPKEKYQIIFVNDSSTDNSLIILNKIAASSNVFIYNVPDDYLLRAHKKRAISYGIEKSKGEIIVTTDADCRHTKDWLRSMLKFMDKNTAFVSGPVKFGNAKNLFEKIQKVEFAGLVITGAGLIGVNYPVICNGANIAYRKKVFREVGGFSNQLKLSSGDDELLMQKIFRNSDYKIKFAYDKNAIVVTSANKSLRDFYYQRKRWASKSLFYENNFLLFKLILIFLFYLSLLLFPILGFMISYKLFIAFIITFSTKVLFEYLILKKGRDLLFDKNVLNPFLITEILQVPYIIIAVLMGIFGNFHWKDRKIKR